MLAICAGLMRSGSVAMWQVMGEIVLSQDAGRVPPLGTEFDDNVEKWACDDQIVVTKLHVWRPSLMNVTNNADNCHIYAVVVIRDIRDVVVSLMHFKECDFKTAVQSRAYINYKENWQDWMDEMHDRSILVRYEDFMADRPGMVAHVAEFMGLPIDMEEATRIANKWGIKRNKKRAEDKHAIRSRDYMAERHIHSGAAEQWRNELSEEQIVRIEEENGDWLRVHGYKLHTDKEISHVEVSESDIDSIGSGVSGSDGS